MAGSTELTSRIAEIEKRDRKSARDQAVANALSARLIDPAMAKTLKTKKLAFVEQYLELHKTPLVKSDVDVATAPAATRNPETQSRDFGPGTGPSISQDPIAHAIASAAAVGVKVTRESVIAGMAAMNGKSRTPEV